VRASQLARGDDPGRVDALLAADEARRAAVTRADGLRGEQKAASQAVKTASKDERPAVLERAKALAADVKAAEAAQTEAEAALRAAHLAVPNVVLDGVPPGGEQDFVVLQTVGQVPTYDFTVRDHLDIGTALGAIDTERGAKVSGSRFAFLTGWGALLELALVNLSMGAAGRGRLHPVIAPALVRPEAMEGTGFLGAHADEVYRLAADDLYLVGTSEVPLAAYHSGEVLDDLPYRYAGFSSCFRREAGSHGKDTRGIIRVHQFDKVEMFSYVAPEQAEAEHARLLAYERAFLSLLELPFRVIDVAAGDLGSSAARKFDCEAWLPSQERWLELTSTSNCTDFQARRLGIRARGEAGLAPVATLNGTLCAIGRTIAVLLRCTSAPTARCTCRRRCAPTWPGAPSCCRCERPSSPPRLVASDLDGTLVRTDQSVSDRTRAVLARVEDAGALFVMVTGRPPRWMAPVAEQTGHRGLAVCANGAIVYDLHTERVVRDFRLDGDRALELVEALRAAVPGVAFAVEKGPDGFGRERSYVPRWDNGEVLVAPVEEPRRLGRRQAARPPRGDELGRPAGPGPGGRRRPRRVHALERRRPARDQRSRHLQGLRAGPPRRRVGRRGRGRHRVRRHAERPADARLGRPSVGMGNAHPDVLAAVDEVTATNDDDGVPKVLERWF
jgi:seryl-tRNA synthetase